MSSSDRLHHIGGSDLGSVLNLPPYGCARRLWYEKRAVEPDYAERFNGALVRGTKLEDLIAEEYTAQTGRVVRRRGVVKGTAHESGHMDRHIVAFDERGPGVLECKTMGERVYRKAMKEGLPLSYQIQLQWYIGLSGWSWGSFAVLWPDGWQFQWFDVAFDPETFSMLRDEASKFWALVENGPAPEALPPSDKRCGRCPYRLSCQGMALIEGVDVSEAASIPELSPLLEEYVELRDIRDEAEEGMEAVKTKAAAIVGSAGTAETPGYRLVWKPVTSNRVDTNALKQKYPDVYKNVVKPSVSRPFKVYPA